MEVVLEKHEKLKLKYQKLYEMTKSYKNGYKKSQKKINNLSVINENLKKKMEQSNKRNAEEVKSLKAQIYKYKQIGSDFATKKKVLFLQQTVNTQEEKVFKLKEKLKDQNNQISNFNDISKNIKGENIDLKNTLNNIQMQISKHFPKSVTPSSEDITPEPEKIIEEVIDNKEETLIEINEIEEEPESELVIEDEVADEADDEEKSDIESEDRESSDIDSDDNYDNIEL